MIYPWGCCLLTDRMFRGHLSIIKSVRFARQEVVVVPRSLPRKNKGSGPMSFSSTCKCHRSRVYSHPEDRTDAQKRQNCLLPRKPLSEAASEAMRGRALWKRGRKRESDCNILTTFRVACAIFVEKGKETRERLQHFWHSFNSFSCVSWKRGRKRESDCNMKRASDCNFEYRIIRMSRLEVEKGKETRERLQH